MSFTKKGRGCAPAGTAVTRTPSTRRTMLENTRNRIRTSVGRVGETARRARAVPGRGRAIARFPAYRVRAAVELHGHGLDQWERRIVEPRTLASELKIRLAGSRPFLEPDVGDAVG